jgi:hypothetical protein
MRPPEGFLPGARKRWRKKVGYQDMTLNRYVCPEYTHPGFMHHGINACILQRNNKRPFLS